MSRSRVRTIVASVLLLAGGSIVGLVASEAAYRVTRLWVCVGGSPGMSAQLRSSGWMHRPVTAAWAFRVHRPALRVSDLRAHQRPRAPRAGRAYEKPAGVRRTLLLGDSITAVPVADDETFAVRIGRSSTGTGSRW